jgi:hypothetical protein
MQRLAAGACCQKILYLQETIPAMINSIGLNLKKHILVMALSLAFLSLNAQNFKWAGSFGNEYDLNPIAITSDPSGNVFSIGHFLGKIDFDPGAGKFEINSFSSNDFYISKLDANGKFVWAKRIRNAGHLEVSAIVADDSGNVFVAGSFGGMADFDPDVAEKYLFAEGENVFILKLDAAGTYVWARQMGGYDDVRDEAWAYAIARDQQGNIFTTGVFSNTVDFDPGPAKYDISDVDNGDVFISKLDRNGNFVWAKTVGTTSRDYGVAIATDIHGSVYATGRFQSGMDMDPGPGTFNLQSKFDDFFILKLNSAGNFAWAKSMGGNAQDYVKDLAVDANGLVVTTGAFQDTADFDPGAGTYKLVSKGFFDIFISALDTAGNFKWARSMAGTDRAEGSSVGMDGSGNVYTTGFFTGTVDLDPGLANNTVISKKLDIFISKLDAAGNFVWVKVVSGFSNDQGNGIDVSSSGNVHLTGTYKGKTDFDPGAGILEFSPVDADASNIFVMKLGNCNVEITREPADKTVDSGSNALFSVAATEPGSSYQWQQNTGSGFVDLANGGQYAGVKNDTLLITNVTRLQTKYKYRCVVSDGKCSDTSYGAVLTVKSTSVQSVADLMEIKVYPNPASAVLTIRASSAYPDLRYAIADQAGREILGGKMNEGSATVDISLLNAGFYLVRIGDLHWQNFVVIK